MKTLLNKTFIFLILLSSSADASTDIDFNFSIKGDHFNLQIKQNFKKPIIEIRKKFSASFLPQISNIVRSAEVSTIKETISRISVTGIKHGLSSTTVNICAEKNSPNDWSNVCSLDLESGDTGDYFNSGTETIHCISTNTGSSCTFTLEASVKPQRFLLFYRSSEVLALGGIIERIHDQSVLSRVINLDETPSVAKSNFEESNIATCLDQIYSKYQKMAQYSAYTNKPLEVQSSLWRCNR